MSLSETAPSLSDVGINSALLARTSQDYMLTTTHEGLLVFFAFLGHCQIRTVSLPTIS